MPPRTTKGRARGRARAGKPRGKSQTLLQGPAAKASTAHPGLQPGNVPVLNAITIPPNPVATASAAPASGSITAASAASSAAGGDGAATSAGAAGAPAQAPAPAQNSQPIQAQTAAQALPPAGDSPSTTGTTVWSALGAEAHLYVVAQSIFHLLSADHRDALVVSLKAMRPAIRAQLEHIPDAALKHKMTCEFSPPLFPDAPHAPPDLPVETQTLLQVMADESAKIGMSATMRQHSGWIDIADLLPRLGWYPKAEMYKRITDAEAAATAAATAAAAAAAAATQAAATNTTTATDAAYGNNTKALLRRPRDEDVQPDRRHKRQRIAIPADVDSSDSSDSGGWRSSENSDDDDDDDDVAAGTGGAGRVLRPPKTAGPVPQRVRNRHWAELPYEARLHKLGPGMTREETGPYFDSDFDSDSDSGSDAPGRLRTAHYEESAPGAPDAPGTSLLRRWRGKHVPPRFTTFAQAMAEAPDDYEGLEYYFDWEMRHGRSAPAILPRDRKLAWVPWLPMPRLPTAAEYDPKLPPGGGGPDDYWYESPAAADTSGDEGGGSGVDDEEEEDSKDSDDNEDGADTAAAPASAVAAAAGTTDATPAPSAALAFAAGSKKSMADLVLQIASRVGIAKT